MTIPGYNLNNPVSKADDLILYRANRIADEVAVLLKAPAGARPSPLLLSCLEHEYDLTRDLDPSLIARPLALERYDGNLALVLAQGPDRTLAAQLGSPMDIGSFLRIAIAINASLAEVHRHKLVHKDIKPENVLLDETGHVWLTGLGIATRLPREHQAPEPPEAIAGTLAYMAPEQTGRMNRSIDSRSDLYALGVTFYQMLTGVLPFTACDAMEWVHCHIARQPIAPRLRVTGIPELLSAMVMKLLAKMAEERYQSTVGLDADLRRCLEEWEAKGRIESFPLGEHDVPDRLLIPEKLYGRQSKIDTLLAAFNRVATSGTAELVLVSGYSGIGKTSVVHELHKALVPFRGLFAAGKFDQFKRDVPYATLVQALQTLIRHILCKGQAEMAGWRDAIQAAVSSNGQLIVNLIPEVEIIIGQQPSVPDLPPQEAQNRFHTVLRNFLGCIAGPEHPLVLFLDDLQWLDIATLELIEQLVTRQEMRNLLLIGAYRDNEVGPAHPLMRIIEAIRKTKAGLREIVLAPLDVEDVCSLAADAFRCDRKRALPLARLVHEKTGGNPFFAIQFLTELAEEKLLAFDASAGSWVWDLARIRAKGFSDNVVDLMLRKLGRLPAKTLEVLKKFACLGNVARIASLTAVCGQSREALHATLWEAVYAGLIFSGEDTYNFLHDRVREAAYSLIPEASRSGLHAEFGRLLLTHTPEEKQEEMIFEIVSQLNRGIALITSPPGREKLAELNLTAGKRAKASAAYAAALTYFATGASVLPDDCRERRHELAFFLEINRAECELLSGDRESAEQRLTAISGYAADAVEQAAVACLRIDLYTALGKSDHAISVGLDFLRHLGVECRPDVSEEEVRREYERIREILGRHTLEELLDRPLMSNPTALAAVDVMTKIWPPALFTNPNLASLVICKAVSFSLEWGNCDASCFAYALLGRIAGRSYGDYREGFLFGQLGCELVERFGLKRFKARTFLSFSNSIMPWMKHVQDGHDLQERAFEIASLDGDLLYGVFACNSLNTNRLFAGTPLSQVQSEVEQRLAFAEKTEFDLVIESIATQLALIRTLRGLTPKLGSFDDGQYSEVRVEQHFADNPTFAITACGYWIRKLQARCIFGDYATAIEAASKAQQLLWTAPLAFEEADYYFFAAITQAAYYTRARDDQRRQLFEALVVHHRQLEIWSQTCPANFENRAALVGAEIARIENRILDAERLYEKAIASARQNGFVHNEALAYELAADFYLHRGFEKFARTYLGEAVDCYTRWGADGKVRQLEQRYSLQHKEEPLHAPVTAFSIGPRELDIHAVIRSSQAISGEIVLDSLLKTLMRIILENAGARQGYLLLNRNGELSLSIEAHVENQNVLMRVRNEPGFQEVSLPGAILNYVSRSRDSVLLDDAGVSNPYSSDEYFSHRHPKSVLCFSITRQTELVGVLYLENDLAAHAFTPDRLTVLELLAAQAAISLENALVYEASQESEAKYRRIMDTTNEGVWMIDPHETTSFVNVRMSEILGYSVEDMIGHPLTDFMFEEDKPDHYQKMKHRWKGLSEHYERRFRRKDGETVWVLISATPILDETQHLQGSIAMVTDITERRRAEDELRHYKDQLEETVKHRTAELLLARNAAEAANKAKSVFLANMSHELRTPMNAILGFSNMMRRDPQLTENQEENLAIINRSGEHLLTLINDVLEVAKIEAGHLQLDIAPFDLGGLVRDVTDMMRIRAQEKGLQLWLDQSSDFPRYIKGDEARIRQIIINLIGNAVKFTQQGGVTLRLGNKNNSRQHLLIEVEDTGPGIAPEEQQHLFEPFVQLKRGDTGQGTGLGLTITRQFVQMMRGNIAVESILGKGTLFRVDLPLELVNSADIPVTEIHQPHEVVGLLPGQPEYRIMIVEDQRDNQLLLSRLMNNLGLKVTVVENGQQCLELFSEWRPDLIWMDRRMPVMDGIETTKQLRQMPGGETVKIVAVTASVLVEQQQEIVDAGMDDLIHKPYRFEEIYDCLARHLGVEYIYRSSEENRKTKPATLTAAMLTDLPSSLRNQLKEALESLDSDRIIQVIRQIGETNPALGNDLSDLAKEFNYPSILAALNSRNAEKL